MELRPEQVADLSFYMRTPRCLNTSDPGCQPFGSKVLMGDGSWKEIQDIVVGDSIFSPQRDGTVSVEKVLSTEVHQDQKVMEVVSKIGAYRCSWNHIVPHISMPLISGRRVPTVVNLPCEEILGKSKTYQDRAKIFTCPAIELPGQDLPLDPYFLGVYLGDGTSNGSISLTINSEHLKILDRIKSRGTPLGKRWEERGCWGVRFPGMIPKFKSLGLYSVKSGNRFIPEKFMVSSIQDRLDLLAGLLDSDGDAEGMFYTTSEVLADQVVALVRSVGGMALKKDKVTYFQEIRCDSFAVYCSFAEWVPHCAVHKKQPHPRDLDWKSPRNHSLEIDEIGVDTVYGFTISGDSQWYVTDNWIVTHNTGKTPSVCVYLYYLWDQKNVRSVWSMPKSLLKKNYDELMLWSSFEEGDVVIVDGTPAKREQQMASNAKVFLMGFDCFSSNWETLLGYHPDIDCHACDEIHMGYGGPNSKRTQRMFEAMKKVKYFIGMTGTIVNGRYSSVYPSIHVINPKEYPYGYEEFLSDHAVMDSYGNICAWVYPEKIINFLKNYAIRHTFAEVYGPEAKEIIFEKCQMEKAQRKAYDEFEEQGLLELEESWLDGSLPGVNFIRCRQIMEHPQEFGPPLDKIKQTGKEARLEVHLEQAYGTGKPLVIFAALRPQQERLVALCKKHKLRTGLINGGVSSKKRFEIDEKFNAGELDVVVASPATAGVGFNWGFVDTMIFASVDPMDSSFVQGYRRAIRGKRDTPLRIVVLEYEDSMDQHMFNIIDKKSKMANDVDPSKERLDLQRTGKKRVNMPKGKPSMEDLMK